MVYKWYILPIGGLYATYHPLGEPETTIEIRGEAENLGPWKRFRTKTSAVSFRFQTSGFRDLKGIHDPLLLGVSSHLVSS